MTAAVEVLQECDRLGVTLRRRGDKLVYAPVCRVTAELLDRLKASKPALMAVLADEGKREVVHFRLPSHPSGSWATCLGQPGQARAMVVADLKRRWPDVEVQP